ncbi:TPA: hypothetical protein R8G56_005068 [Citrobacter freundii]|nr:hypothetical protein [Citrobacter freundii]
MKPTYEELERQLEESRREFRAADATIHNLELKLTDMAEQLANAESKCRELAAAENNLIDSECHVAEPEDALRDKQALIEAAEKRIAEHNFENLLLANADRDIKALRERIAELEAVREVFLRAKALMYQSGGAPIENSLNPIDAWLYDAELIAAGIGVKGD